MRVYQAEMKMRNNEQYRRRLAKINALVAKQRKEEQLRRKKKEDLAFEKLFGSLD